MPSLKDLRDRKKSVESTKKITSAMKMVAAAKLRRAQEQAESARVYADALEDMLRQLTSNPTELDTSVPLIHGNGNDQRHLYLVMTSDRGLCGGFNGSLFRELRAQVKYREQQGQQTFVYIIGRKGRDLLKAQMSGLIMASRVDVAKPKLSYATAESIAAEVVALFEQGQYDVCHIVYSKFRSAMMQIPTTTQLIPIPTPGSLGEDTSIGDPIARGGRDGFYTYEPDAETILRSLSRKNVTVQIFRALLQSAASEHGARMSAMDNATRNAGDMIRKLDLTYNRARQAYITKELIEIISGAEAI